MSKLVELYVKELTREGSTMTINDVPKKLRKQVEDAIAAIEAAARWHRGGRGERMIARALAWLLLKIAGKEEREMLVRLYAGEIIMGRITEDNVPAKLKARVHKYLVDMGYFDDVEE